MGVLALSVGLSGRRVGTSSSGSSGSKTGSFDCRSSLRKQGGHLILMLGDMNFDRNLGEKGSF